MQKRLFLGIFFVLVMMITAVHAQSDDADLPPPQTVTIAGTLQPQLGCPGEWDTTCTDSMLAYDPLYDLYLATFALPAGNYEYKAALNGTWDDNYGLNAEYYGPNIPLTVAEDGPVTFFYDHKTRWVSDSINSIIATVPGSYQPTVGCTGEWQPECLRSLLQDPDGDGTYTFVTALIPAGEYEAKVALNQSWGENYGADGVQDGPNIPFTVPENAQTTFSYDPTTHQMTISTADAPADAITSLADLSTPDIAPAGQAAPAKPDLVVIPGTIQSVLGCLGDWQADCEATALIFDEISQIWHNSFDLPAGSYEYKAALNGSWDVNFGLNATVGGANIPLNLTSDTRVTFYFDHVTGWVTDDVNSPIITAFGDFQTALGCAEDGQADCLSAWLQDPEGDGVFIFQTADLPPGDYTAQAAIGLTLDEVYGANGEANGEPIPFNVAEEGAMAAFIFDISSNLLTVAVGDGSRPAIPGNLGQARAYWVTADTIAWDVDTELPSLYQLHYGHSLALTPAGITGGETLDLTRDEAGLSRAVLAKFPHLQGLQAFKIGEGDLALVPEILRGQTAVSASDDIGALDTTSLQIPGVLDALYTYDGPLGVTFSEGIPSLRLWAPTAQSVNLHLFADSNPETPSEVVPMAFDTVTGVWSATGEEDWHGRYYLYEVTVYAPAAGSAVTNLVTDPYSVSLSTNSTRSQIVNLNDGSYKPEGWDEIQKPSLAAPEDIVIYEIHLRDFSVNDPTVPEEHRGTYLAFTDTDSNGRQHLADLAAAGLTHLHLLPTFDITSINENKAEWVEPDLTELASFLPDSEEQQALIGAIRDQDGFNWGYDPYHYTVPEGSYATDPDGPARIVEYRQMVQSLSDIGLRVVTDVVYNHTSSSGQAATAVLDRIVPGYYHRLNNIGHVETSTCCQNTATEHNMMRKLMVDSVVTWAVAYKIDAFRFDLMGHHMVADMQAVREALDALTLEADGVDGKRIYLYGEGWNFGEVADNARGVNATQANMAGTGVGTFNDRLRDAVRGGTPFAGQTEQGFINGLYYDANDFDQGTEEAQLERLLQFSDLIRVGLAGNLRNYWLMPQNGRRTTASGIDYNDSPAAYTDDPQENIIYISKHDNETLFDIIQYKAPLDSTMDERVRMQNMGLSIVALSQGVPFFQAGSDMLRSKSLDRNSYNSGDWFNRLDFSYETNNWAVGLPPAADNQDMWPLMATILSSEGLTPDQDHILRTVAHFQEMLQIRQSSPLFRLQTADQVSDRLVFHNTGPFQQPGLIVMSLSDSGGENLDANYGLIVVLFNANDEAQQFTEALFTDLPLSLHPVQQSSADAVVQTAAFAPSPATFTVPGRTTAVFVLAEADTPSELVAPEPEPTPEPTLAPTPEPTDEPAPEATAEPAEEESVTATAVPLIESEPAAEETESDEPNSALPWVIGGGVLLAAGAGYVLTRRKN